MVICLSCILNWFALAYKPIGSLFSKKVLKKNSMIRALSGLIQSVSTSSLMTFNQREFSLNMVAVRLPILILGLLRFSVSNIISKIQLSLFTQSTFGGGGSNEGKVMFDTNTFLSWWFGGKKSSETSLIDRKPFATPSNLDISKTSKTEFAASPALSAGIESSFVDKNKVLFHKSSATDIPRGSTDSPTFIAGYMDFDPMVAATRIHSSSAHHRGRRASWFNRSD